MPGIWLRPEGMGWARRWNSGKSTWTWSRSASKLVSRSVAATSFWRHDMQILQPLVEAQISQPMDADLQSEPDGQLFVHPGYQALAVEAPYRMAVVELFPHTVQPAAQAPVLANPQDRDDLVGCEAA